MGRQRLVVALALLFVGCSKAPLGGSPSFDASVPCEDRDHDGFGRGCERGYDCNDDDPRSTTECRTCSRPERGCACEATEGPVSCFLDDQELEGGDVLCSEGTRHCRAGVWSGCEDVRQYIAAPSAETQRVLDPMAGKVTCSVCDAKCFKIVDHLLADGGVAGGNVTFGPGGGITLLPGDAGAGSGDGGTGLTGCAAMTACCSTLSDSLKTACQTIAMGGDNTICDRDRPTYCPSGTVTGPVPGCTLGSGADTDCDGIPNEVDATPGKPIATTNNQTIFHQLDIGETGGNSIDISFKLRNADVYFLLDMTNTMKEERDNLISSLTTGNVINCAHLNQCCNRLIGAAKTSCQDALKAYTNRPNQADDQAACLAEQTTYCPGNKVVDCPDNDGNGAPDNHLKTQGVVGATRCLVGSAWFGAGFAREMPIQADPSGCSADGCSTKYADRDEQLFKNSIDMTADYTKVLTALQSMQTNGNWDDPEGGMMALYSVITGNGHYFGINRPSIPPRIAATQCPPNSFGYPCFRKDAVPIVVFFTDRPHHNGPPDPKNCSGEGAGCPYNRLSGVGTTTWTSRPAESSSDKVARFVPVSAETFATAYNAGDLRGQYLTLVGDTRFMAGDYPTTLIGCGAASTSPDALIRFRVTAPPGAPDPTAPIPINFHLTKDDAYSAGLYGTWRSDRTNDPSPATEFGSVITLFRGVPNAIATNTDLGDRQAFAISSGPDSTYLTYTGTTMGAGSAPGFLGGISSCAADGLSNQMVFTFRPSANARIVVDASESGFPAVLSLHEGLPSSLPKNPNTMDGSSVGIANTNDTFATANAVPTGATSIDGEYVERKGDSNVGAITANYTTLLPRTIYGKRTTDSDTLTGVTSTAGIEPGMELSSSAHWTTTPVRVVSVGTDTIKLSGKWEGDPPPDPSLPPQTDPAPLALTFLDTLVGCGVDPAGKDTVFKFNVATPRRVRIDTEGSSYDTVISLHDAPPPTVINKNDVAGNATAPGYQIGEVNNASHTLDALGMGTGALTSNYEYAQCGAGKSSKDAVFRFTLDKPTRLGLETSSDTFDPIVGLFSSPPGNLATLSNTANNNDNLTAPRAAFNLGDIYGAVDTKVTGSDLAGMSNDWDAAVVGCGAYTPGRDQIFKFTPLSPTRARIKVTPSGSAWNPVFAVFDDTPPSSVAITTTAVFDAAAVTLPDSNCLAFSYHDPATAAPAHTYAVCPTKYYSNDANARCVSAGMNYLASINSAAEQAFIMNTSVTSYRGNKFHIGAVDPEGDNTFVWRDGTGLTYSNWVSGEPNDAASNNKCAVLSSDASGLGQWSDGKCTSSGATAADSTYYICEDVTPAVLPNEDAATAYAIPPTTTRVVTGNTRRMSNDYNGATLLSACNGTSFGGDAVFSITTGAGTSYQLGVDSAGSSYNVVLGLFENTIDAAGYLACDAAGGGALAYTLLPSRTYYVVVKGTALSQEGSYKLKFSNLSAPVATGTQLSCAKSTPTVPTGTTEVDVDANHTYYVVVDQADAAFGKYDLEINSLYRSRNELGNAASANETGENAVSLPDPYRSRVTVVDTSTAGMTADYGNGAGGMCSASPAAPDAVYKFTPSLSTNVTFKVDPQGVGGLSNVAIGVFDGPPGTSAVTHDLNASGNLNEAGPSAQAVSLTGPAQLYLGNTSAMAANVDASLLACGARPNGRDAVFSFSLAKQTNVEIDAAASAVSDPVINLFGSGALSRPTQVTLENDTKLNADSNPTPTPQLSSSWLYYGGDLSRLSAESQAPVSLAAVNDDTPPATLQPQDLGDVSGKRVAISGGDTGPMRADYPKLSCAGVDGAADALYKFTSSTAGLVHIKATPASGFDGVIGLFDGSNGLPVSLSQRGSLTEDAACVPPNGPKNLTNTTLKSISSVLAAAPAINLNCGNSAIVTNDPDGAGAALVAFQNWCGSQPTVLLQQQPDGAELVIIITNSFTIASGSRLRVLGERPVLFVVNGTANIAGELNASPEPGSYPGIPGAGGDIGCGTSYGGNALSSGTNSGGGGGGGFRTAGGIGGFGSSSSVAGGAAGTARANSTLVPLVGGCSGGDGAFGLTGGLGAGAVQISATTSITLAPTGSIVANGGAGTSGGSGQAGGSGGGSGGAVMLQAPTVTYMASQISARGGAGGGGLGSPATTGGAGAATNAAPGGAGQNSNAAAGGGGGGGGYGLVVVQTGAVSLAQCTMATNESGSNAWFIPLDGSGREFIERGSTSGMSSDHGGVCGTSPNAPDAVYSFSLTQGATVKIDATASANGTSIALFNASSLGSTPTATLLENDDGPAADTNPTPTPDAYSNWLRYRGDLQNLTASSQPQTTVDNGGNFNEIIPTELPNPIDRRITVTNANTSAMSADYLAASCSVPAADNARDAIYRFVPSKDGLVRLSANYSQTAFNPAIVLYRGTREVLDERVLLVNQLEGALSQLNINVSTIKVRNLARTVQYTTADYTVVARDSKTPVVIKRTAASAIPNNVEVSVDYEYESGAPLPISQQQVTTVSLGNTNENGPTAQQVPIESGRAYVYTGNTTAMSADVNNALFTCGPPDATGRDATFAFSLDKPTSVSISTEGSAFDTNIAVFSGSITRPSTSLLRSPAPVLTQLYDVQLAEGYPESTCTPREVSGEVYWFCSTARTWEQAEGMCRGVGLHLVTIDSASENNLLQTEISATNVPHHIGFTEAMPYTNSWGTWTSGGGDTTGAAVSGRFTRWASNEPNGSGDCLQLLSDGTWDDADCALAKNYVCERDDTTPTSPPPGGTCGSVQTYGGHLYYVCTDKQDWATAKSRCTSVGMRLARVDDQPEDDQLRTLVAGNPAWIGGSDSATEGAWVWADGVGFWTLGAYRNWATGEPDNFLTNPGARMRASDGKWEDTPITSQTARYICEDMTPPASLPTPPIASSPRVVDVFSPLRQFKGSTQGVTSSVAGIMGCGTAAGAPDAVFQLDLNYQTTLGVDISGSFSGAVVGLFRSEITATGYGNAGSRCGLVGSAAPQLTATVAPGTYYVVISGTTVGSSGVYNLRIDAQSSDATAFAMNNDTLPDAVANPLGGVDGKWLVKRTDMATLTPTAIATTNVDMGAGTDLNDINAQSLGTLNDNRLTVSNASTGDLAADYSAGSCNAAASGADALYSFQAASNDPVQVRFTPSSWSGQVVLYDGLPATIASAPNAPISLAPGYSNEAPVSAQSTPIAKAQAYLGNMTMMANDVPAAAFNQSFNAGGGSPTTCNADAAGGDAFFKFTVSGGSKNVEISSAGTAVAHTIALWDTKPFIKPAATAVQYDTRTAANMVGTRLGSGGDIDDDWVVVTGNTTTLTPYNGYTTFTETVDYAHDDSVHLLGNVNGLEVVTVNASTTGLAADYLASTLQCGGSSDTAPDAAFRFTHGAGGRVRLSLNNPTPEFAPTMSLFRGAGPLKASEINPPQVATTNTNEAHPSAFTTDAIASAKIYTGNTSAMMNNYAGTVFTQGSAYGSKVCTPEAAGRDAFVKFTLAAPKTVEISSLAASFNQTIALWDSTPIVAPTATAMSHDTRSAAYTTPIGIIDDKWEVKAATMTGLMPDALTALAPSVVNNDEVQDLGNPVGRRIAVSGNTATAGVLADFTAGAGGAVMCGTSNTAPDIIYKVRPTANTTVRAALNNPSAPSFSAAIAVLNGASADPQRMSDLSPAASTTAYCSGSSFGYTPTNFPLGSGAGQVSFTTAANVTLTACGTITYNSDSDTWSPSFCSQTKPPMTVVTQAGGPSIAVLAFKSLNIAAGTTVVLTGTRAVAFAVEGNATVAGTINASASGTTPGAGGNWSCGTSDGNDGTGSSSSGGGGGGGGAFGTNGASGGYGDNNGNQGAGGTARGNTNITPLYGGCNGGRGGGCSAVGAAGGGAVQISAGAVLTVLGSIVANGANGANGCGSEGGGTGGGSGGGILLEGSTVNVTGALTANGGRGGNGSGGGSGGNGSTSSASAGSTGGSDGTNGGGGGGGGYGRIRQRVAPCVPSIETFATAADVPIGLTQTFTGPSSAMASNVSGASFNSGGCNPDATGPDAFWKFTLTRTTNVQINAQGTNHNHTLSLFNSGMSVTNCNDGSSVTGGTITRSLAAGTYYVGLKSRNGGVGGNFSVAFREANSGSPYATSMGCATTSGTGFVDASLTANTDYYIVVKGASGTLSGAYNLVVTDIGAVQAPTCGDPSAPDAYFDFEVNDAAGRNVTIELNETSGKLDGSFQLMRDAGTLNNASDDVAVGTCQTSATTYNALAKGRYYVVLRGAALPGTQAAEITIKDQSGSNALDCADANSGAAATITRTLAAGTYYAGITSRAGGSAGGAYRLQIRDTSIVPSTGGTFVACADTNHNLTYDIPPADAGVEYYVVVKGLNNGGAGKYALTVTDLSSVQDLCDSGDTIQMDPTAPDAYYAFNLTDADGGGRDVTVSLASTSALDGAYRLFRFGSPNVAVGSCHDKSAPFTYTDLPAGNYYIALRGKNVASGAANAAFELAVNDRDAYGSLVCRDGVVSTGTTITRTLTAGDYFVGIKPQPGAANPKEYKLQFRDTAVALPTSANELGCGTSVINANVSAGSTYYVLVKGANGTAKGSYGLSVTDLGGGSAWNCNDDPTGGDAFFEFNVDDPSGRLVTVDTEGSALDTVVAIFPAGSPINASGKLACDDDSGATMGSSKITRNLAPGVYYAVVRPKLGASNPTAPFEISVRDDNAYGSVACAATSGGVKAQLKKTLGPGTYYTVLKGQSGSAQGAYKIRFRDETPYENAASEIACDDVARELTYNVTADKPYYAVVKGAAADQSGAYRLTVENMVARNGMGCNANNASPDAVYRFHLSQDTQVQIDTIGSPIDTVIALYDTNAGFFGTNYANNRLGTPVNCDDDSGGSGWSKIVADLAGNRDYYVVVKSKSSGWGGVSTLPYFVSVKDMASNQPIACASTSSALTEALPAGDYRVVVSTVNGTTGTPFDVKFTNTTAASSGALEVACSDTPEELTYNVVANRPYYLMVKGDASNDRGQYGLVVETAGASATSMGCGASPEAPDAFFKFDLAAAADVVIDTEDSTVDTVIALYPGATNVFGSNYTVDVNGALVPCDDDGGVSAGASRIQARLAAGSYYVVVKGKSLGWNTPSQNFNLSIRDQTNSGSIACASSSQGNKRIVQSLAPGDYQVVMSTASAAGGAYSLKFRDTDLSGVQNGAPVSCVASGSLTVNNLTGGREYYVVVKGNTATDAGGYTLTMEDAVSAAAASGSTSVACAAEGMMIDGTYPAGTYYALVTGKDASDSGPYTLKVRDLDALQDQNRLACDDNGGPNNTSVIERDLKAGTHYVVVKGNGESSRGAYSLHIRDKTAVPDRELACGGAEQAERVQADVKANQDYTVVLKSDAAAASGAYNVKMYDQNGLTASNGQNLKCLADPQPATLVGTDWHRSAVDFDYNLAPDTYYVAVKGRRAIDKGTFQLQMGEKSARTTTTYRPPVWAEIQDALSTSAARVLPVIATGGETDTSLKDYVSAAEEQAKILAMASKAIRKTDGSPIWQKIQKTGRGTGSGLITGIAELADYLSMDVMLVALDGPDAGASKFRIEIAPVNSPSCAKHPLVDTTTGACTGTLPNYSCNTQYDCLPGSAPKFLVSFTNPSDAPVPPNPSDPYGGYHFKMQLVGDKQYLLDEVPVYIIPTNHAPMGPPGGGSGSYQSSGTYEQDITSATCPLVTDLPQWSDLFFSAGMPEGTSIDMELCTKEKKEDLSSCVWSNGAPTTRKKVTVRSAGTCVNDAQCRNVDGFGSGFCAVGTCQFISEPKVAYDIACTNDSQCPSGPLGAGDYVIRSRCETTPNAFGYGHCVYSSQPADMGATLLAGEQGRPYGRVRFTLRPDATRTQAPTLFEWNLRYYCKSAQ